MNSYEIFFGDSYRVMCFSDSPQPKTIRSLHRPLCGPTNISFSLVKVHEDRDGDRDRDTDTEGTLSSH